MLQKNQEVENHEYKVSEKGGRSPVYQYLQILRIKMKIKLLLFVLNAANFMSKDVNDDSGDRHGSAIFHYSLSFFNAGDIVQSAITSHRLVC